MKLINTIIVKRIINKYKQDMGNYFDFVQVHKGTSIRRPCSA